MVIATSLLALYIVGVPGLIVRVTTKHHDDLNEVKYRRRFGFLYNGYRLDFAWWEAVVLLRKTTIAVVLVFIEDPFIQSLSATQISSPPNESLMY